MSARILIVGAGPAGISAAAWLESLHVEFDWVGTDSTNGLDTVHNPITNLPPMIWESGVALAGALREFTARLDHRPNPTEVRTITSDGDELVVDGTPYRAVILATGTRRRRLGLAGESSLYTTGHLRESSTRDAHLFSGEEVLVVGGGDAAFESALNLEAAGARVTLALRSAPRARASFLERVDASEAISVMRQTTVETLMPKKNRLLARLNSPQGTTQHIFAGGFVRIGVEAALPEVAPSPETDAEGYLIVDLGQETTVPGLLAAGDLAAVEPRGVATAIGQGARAAKNAASLATQKL